MVLPKPVKLRNELDGTIPPTPPQPQPLPTSTAVNVEYLLLDSLLQYAPVCEGWIKGAKGADLSPQRRKGKTELVQSFV